MSETNTKRSTGKIVAFTVIALVLVGGGVTWGITLYRDAKLTEEAQAYVHTVSTARSDAEAARATHLQSREAAQASLGALQPSVDIIQSRTELFTSETLTPLTDTFAALSENVEYPATAEVVLTAPFDDPDFETLFVTQYRDAEPEHRVALAEQSDTTVEDLTEFTQLMNEADTELAALVIASQRAAVSLAQTLPDQAHTIASGHPEADETTVTAIHTAASVEGWSEVSDAQLSERVAELQDRLIVYVESADRVSESHKAAVALREEAERQAAEEARRQAAAAAQASAAASGSGSGSGSSKPRMCNKVSPGFGGNAMSLRLVPC